MNRENSAFLGFILGYLLCVFMTVCYVLGRDIQSRDSFEKEAISNGVADYKLEVIENIPKVVFYWKSK